MTFNPDDIDRWPRREPPSDHTFWIRPNTARPTTALQALMETAPGDSPESSLEEVADIREAVATGLGQMSEEDVFILQSVHFEGISIRDLGVRLGLSKTQAGRLVQRARARLERLLMTDPVIRARIGVEPTWNDACREQLMSLAPDGLVTDEHAKGLILLGIERSRESFETGTNPTAYLRLVGEGAAVLLEQRLRWSVERLERLLCSKQADYGVGNILAFGVKGITVRMSDKVARWENLTAEGRPAANETLDDTYDDMVGYAVVASMLANGTFTNPLITKEEAA